MQVRPHRLLISSLTSTGAPHNLHSSTAKVHDLTLTVLLVLRTIGVLAAYGLKEFLTSLAHLALINGQLDRVVLQPGLKVGQLTVHPGLALLEQVSLIDKPTMPPLLLKPELSACVHLMQPILRATPWSPQSQRLSMT